jgi:hypothetical protein
MRRLGFGVLWAIAGYLVFALAGYFLLQEFSSNAHDRSVEAAMTSVFAVGPLGAIVGFIVGFASAGRTAKVTLARD